MTDDVLTAALRQALRITGDAWRAQPSLLQRPLVDALGPQAKANRGRVHWLVIGAQERVPDRLARLGEDGPGRLELADELAATRGWTAATARWTVATWAAALGLDTAPVDTAPVHTGPVDTAATDLPDPSDRIDPPLPEPSPVGSLATVLPAAPRPVVAPPPELPPPPAPPTELPPPPASPVDPGLPPPPRPAPAPAPTPAAPAAGPTGPTPTGSAKLRRRCAELLGRPVDAAFVGYVGNPAPIALGIAGAVVGGVIACVGILISATAVIVVGAVVTSASSLVLDRGRKTIPVRWLALADGAVTVVDTARDGTGAVRPTGVAAEVAVDQIEPVEGGAALKVGDDTIRFLPHHRGAHQALAGGAR